MLIRGTNGSDWGILRTSWINFVRGRNAGKLKADLFVINGKDSYWKSLNPTDTNGKSFQWTLNDQTSGMVDFEKGNITFSDQVTDVGEFIALGCAMAISFVLCQPRPPPPKDGQPYPEPPSNRPRVMHLDSMGLLVAGGLYAKTLPRWYHTKSHGGYYYQIHPTYWGHHHYYGGCGAGDFGYDYDAGGCRFDDDGSHSGDDFGGGDDFDFDGDMDGGNGGDFDWGGDGGDAGGCGGCGGGDSGGAGCGSSGGGCASSGGGGGCGSSCGGGDSGGGGGCGSSCGGGGGCGGGGCGGD